MSGLALAMTQEISLVTCHSQLLECCSRRDLEVSMTAAVKFGESPTSPVDTELNRRRRALGFSAGKHCQQIKCSSCTMLFNHIASVQTARCYV